MGHRDQGPIFLKIERVIRLIILIHTKHESVLFLVQEDLIDGIAKLAGDNLLGLPMVHVSIRLTVPVNGTFDALIVVLDSPASWTKKIHLFALKSTSDPLLIFLQPSHSALLQLLIELVVVFGVVFIFFISPHECASLPTNFAFYQDVLKLPFLRNTKLRHLFLQLLYLTFLHSVFNIHY